MNIFSDLFGANNALISLFNYYITIKSETHNFYLIKSFFEILFFGVGEKVGFYLEIQILKINDIIMYRENTLIALIVSVAACR